MQRATMAAHSLTSAIRNTGDLKCCILSYEEFNPICSPKYNTLWKHRLFSHPLSVISGFRDEVSQMWALLGFYPAQSGNSVPTFRGNISDPSSKVKNSRTSWPLKMGPTGCPETSVKDYHSTLHNTTEESRSQHRGGSLKSRKVRICLYTRITSEMYSLPNRLTIWDVAVGVFWLSISCL
jgi:hypothetical protein